MRMMAEVASFSTLFGISLALYFGSQAFVDHLIGGAVLTSVSLLQGSLGATVHMIHKAKKSAKDEGGANSGTGNGDGAGASAGTGAATLTRDGQKNVHVHGHGHGDEPFTLPGGVRYGAGGSDTMLGDDGGSGGGDGNDGNGDYGRVSLPKAVLRHASPTTETENNTLPSSTPHLNNGEHASIFQRLHARITLAHSAFSDAKQHFASQISPIQFSSLRLWHRVQGKLLILLGFWQIRSGFDILQVSEFLVECYYAWVIALIILICTLEGRHQCRRIKRNNQVQQF